MTDVLRRATKYVRIGLKYSHSTLKLDTKVVKGSQSGIISSLLFFLRTISLCQYFLAGLPLQGKIHVWLVINGNSPIEKRIFCQFVSIELE